MGTPSSARIIQDVNLALKALEIVYPEKDGTPYAGRPFGNIPEFIPLYNSLNSLNIYIFQSLRFHFVLILSNIDGKEITEEESKLCFSFSTPR